MASNLDEIIRTANNGIFIILKRICIMLTTITITTALPHSMYLYSYTPWIRGIQSARLLQQHIRTLIKRQNTRLMWINKINVWTKIADGKWRCSSPVHTDIRQSNFNYGLSVELRRADVHPEHSFFVVLSCVFVFGRKRCCHCIKSIIL